MKLLGAGGKSVSPGFQARRDSRRLLLLFSGRFLLGGAFDFGFFCHNVDYILRVDSPAAW